MINTPLPPLTVDPILSISALSIALFWFFTTLNRILYCSTTDLYKLFENAANCVICDCVVLISDLIFVNSFSTAVNLAAISSDFKVECVLATYPAFVLKYWYVAVICISHCISRFGTMISAVVLVGK